MRNCDLKVIKAVRYCTVATTIAHSIANYQIKCVYFLLSEVSVSKGKVVRKKDFTESDVSQSNKLKFNFILRKKSKSPKTSKAVVLTILESKMFCSSLIVSEK